jgi:hypothetical protein
VPHSSTHPTVSSEILLSEIPVPLGLKEEPSDFTECETEQIEYLSHSVIVKDEALKLKNPLYV